jgi:hypothetical protein
LQLHQLARGHRLAHAGHAGACGRRWAIAAASWAAHIAANRFAHQLDLRPGRWSARFGSAHGSRGAGACGHARPLAQGWTTRRGRRAAAALTALGTPDELGLIAAATGCRTAGRRCTGT